MAGQFDVHIVTLPIGSFIGATELPMIHVPAVGGGITVLSAYLLGAAGTIIGGLLVTMSNHATTPALNGTIGAFAGTIITAAGTIFPLTITTPFVDSGYWIGFDTTSGTVPAGSFICLSYLTGK